MNIKQLCEVLNIERKELTARLNELDSIYPLSKTGIKGSFNIQENELDVIEKYLTVYNFFQDKKQALIMMKEQLKKMDLEEDWVLELRKNNQK